MLVIVYVTVRRITCICSACLSKLAPPWNKIQDNYNNVQYKGENQQCVYWFILGSYRNWQITHLLIVQNNMKKPILT